MVSFLTTLDIYKDYFKGRLTGRNWMKLDAKVLYKHIVTGDICSGSSFFLKKLIHLYAAWFSKQGVS